MRHYGFPAAELDFIVNYDIKYRLGRDTETSDDQAATEAGWKHCPTLSASISEEQRLSQFMV